MPDILTPIRVRGRRKKKVTTRHDENSNNNKNNNNGIGERIPRGRKVGRPMLSQTTKLSLSQSKVDQRIRRLHAKPSASTGKRLSVLEALPVELIERIFLYSLNVNLPRSSLSLAATVSSERIYRALILLAFWNDPGPPSEQEKGEPGSESAAIERILKLPLDYVPLHDAARDGLQATILRCQWCTVRRLLDQLPDLMNLTIQRHWHNAGIRMNREQRQSLDRFLTRQEDSRVFQGTDKDNKPCTLSIIPPVSITISRHDQPPEDHGTHRILSVKHFPEKLLKGEEGFTSDNVAFIETLRIAAGLNSNDLMEVIEASKISLPRNALQQGIHNALVENNAAALTTLLKIDEYVFRSQNNTSTSPPYTLPAEHFRTAVRVARNDPTFFQLLFRTSAESLPADDAEVTEWAMDLNNALGRWLLDLMMRLPVQSEAARADPRGAGMFYLGRANGEVEIVRRYLDEVLGVQELDGWMGESEVDVVGKWWAGS